MRLAELDDYLSTFEELRSAKGWTESRDLYRAAALILVPLETAGLGRRLTQATRELRRLTSWADPLRPALPLLAAMALSVGQEASAFHATYTEIRRELRARSLPRGGIHGKLSCALLALGAPVDSNGANAADDRSPRSHGALVDRFAAHYRAWKRSHRFTCGTRSYPFAAVHAMGTAEPGDEPGNSVERIDAIYRDLVGSSRNRRGGASLRLAQLLGVGSEDPHTTTRRFLDVRYHLSSAGFPSGAAQAPHAALLSLVPGDPALLAEVAAEFRDGLRKSRPRPSKAFAARLAQGLVVHEAMRRLEREDIARLAILAQTQSILAALEAEQTLTTVVVLGAAGATG